jgi:hypothetical protein
MALCVYNRAMDVLNQVFKSTLIQKLSSNRIFKIPEQRSIKKLCDSLWTESYSAIQNELRGQPVTGLLGYNWANWKTCITCMNHLRTRQKEEHLEASPTRLK